MLQNVQTPNLYPNPGTVRNTMALQGHLSTVSILDLFSFLHQLRKTGTLCLVSDTNERSFVFQQGDLVYATTKDASRRLGNFLVRLGIINQSELSQSLRDATSRVGYLGETLVETERISTEELGNAVRTQMLDILEETLSWPTGAFHFDENEVPFSLPAGVHVGTQAVLFQVTSTADERIGVRELFPDMNVLLMQEDGASSDELSDEEKSLFALADGNNTIEQILFRHPGGLLTAAKSLHGFLTNGLVRSAGIRVAPEGKHIPDLACLPVAPEASGNIFTIFNQPEHSKEDLTAVLQQDPLLTAKVLKALTANNVELPRSILRVDHLVEVLGSFQLRSLLIPEAVRGLFFPSMDSCWRDCWEHSVLTAQLSREIAKAIEYPFPEEAYIGGLLHDLGVFILMSQNPEKYREVAEEATSSRCDLETIEESRFGISHTKIGGVHAEKWTFPKVITLAIKNHHKSDDIDTKPLVRIVAVASNMAQKAGYGIQSALPDESRLDLNLNQLNLERRKLDNIVENIDWRTLKRSKTDESKETSPGIIAGAT